MSISQEVLLHEHFIQHKKDLYQDDPELLAVVENLTHEDIQSEITEHNSEASNVNFTGQNFVANGMSYVKADITSSPNGWILSNDLGPIVSWEQLSNVAQPGAYLVNIDGLDSQVALVYELQPDEQVITNVRQLLETSFQYILSETPMLDDDGLHIDIPFNGDELCVYGAIPIFEKGSYVVEDFIVPGGNMGVLDIPGV